MSFACFVIALFASTIGAVSGIGGGVIIKPAMDGLNITNVATASFLSGCTVLAMAAASYIRNLRSAVKLDYRISALLALGACLGGYAGKAFFDALKGNRGLIQALLLLAINVFVGVYIVNKKRIKSMCVHGTIMTFLIGVALGSLSAFLGIGGGPVNIAVLYYFFSMEPKETARNSLFIILFSQVSSLAATLIFGKPPVFNPLTLALMCLGGIAGAILGSQFSRKMSDHGVERFFLWVLCFLVLLNIHNAIHFYNL